MDLSNVKAGDKLVEDRGPGMGWRYAEVTVERVTDTQIVGTSGTRWKRRDGSQIGGGTYSHRRLIERTPEIQKEIEAERLLSWAKHYAGSEIGKLHPDQIKQVLALVRTLAGTEGA